MHSDDQGKFDLVVTDQTMPDITGVELANTFPTTASRTMESITLRVVQ